MKIFISLPIEGRNETEQREKADLAKALLSRAGHRPVSTFDNYHGHNADFCDILTQDLRALHSCEAIYLCEGWQFARECRVEANFAKEYGKQFMYEKSPEGDPYYFNR